MYNNPYFGGFREQPITQNFQLANNTSNEVDVRYFGDNENPENIIIYKKTMFIGKNVMILKNNDGTILEKYEIKKVFPVDPKDLQIEQLQNQILELKEMITNESDANVTTNDESTQQNGDGKKSNRK